MVAPVAFSDVVGQRDGGTANLTGELKLFKSRQPPRHRVHRLTKLASKLISLQVLQCLKRFGRSLHDLLSSSRPPKRRGNCLASGAPHVLTHQRFNVLTSEQILI